MEDIIERINELNTRLDSDKAQEHMAVVRAIAELIDVKLGETPYKLNRFSALLRRIFEEKRDPETLIAAGGALRRMVVVGGPITASIVEKESEQAFEWLTDGKYAARRLAAVIILKELAEGVPSAFVAHVEKFIDKVWPAFRDSRLIVREKAQEALRACLQVMEPRETRLRITCYYAVFETAAEGLEPGQGQSTESIHGCLLAMGELFRNSREFMTARDKQAVSTILNFREHRDPLIRRTITSLLPRFAAGPISFNYRYLQMSMELLVGVMKNHAERSIGFRALREMAGRLDKTGLLKYLKDILPPLKDAVVTRRGVKPSPEAFLCVGRLAEVLGEEMTPHIWPLVEALLSNPLSSPLVDSLGMIAKSSASDDDLVHHIQKSLLETIKHILTKKPTRPWTASPVVKPVSTSPPTGIGEFPRSAGLTQLALHTICRFDFQSQDLLDLMREIVIPYLDEEDSAIRKEAGITCCRLLERRCGPTAGRQLQRRQQFIDEALARLLRTAVSDQEPVVRRAVLSELQRNVCFDEFMSQASSLRPLFIVLSDEDFEAKQLAIALTGRLATRNPAYVLPALRKALADLLLELERSLDDRTIEDSAKLLGCLIQGCPQLVIPYSQRMLEVLVAKLSEWAASTAGGAPLQSNSAVVASILTTIGCLSRVGGRVMQGYLSRLMPLVVNALQDESAEMKEVAVTTLGDIVEYTGYVLHPYTDHPHLLGLLLRLLNGELPWSTRREVLKVLGILGALDPHEYKQNNLDPGPFPEGGLGSTTDRLESFGNTAEDSNGDAGAVVLTPSSEDYYPTVAICTLLRLLREPSMSTYHQDVISSLMVIFKLMKLSSVPYLKKVIPELLNIIGNSNEESLREFVLLNLADLVPIVRQHIRKYLPEILSVVYDYWSTMSQQGVSVLAPVLNLLEQLCRALNDEFRLYLPDIVPRCIEVLTDAERRRNFSSVDPVLHAFEVFGANLEDHMQLLLPALIRLFRVDLSTVPVEVKGGASLRVDVLTVPLEVKKRALQTLAQLIPCIQVITGHAAAIYHPLSRVLDGSHPELRRPAMDALCALAEVTPAEFTIFIPTVRKLMMRHRVQHHRFDAIVERLIPHDRRRIGGSLPMVPIMNGPHGIHSNGHAFSDDGPHSPQEQDEAELQPLGQRMFDSTRIKAAWDHKLYVTKEDWAEWMRQFSVVLLQESPSPALHSCAHLAQVQPHVARELFPAAFVNVWVALKESEKDELMRSLAVSWSAHSFPPEMMAVILNLAEFMEHDSDLMQLDKRPLRMANGQLYHLAMKCHAYAKALHYKEQCFESITEEWARTSKDLNDANIRVMQLQLQLQFQRLTPQQEQELQVRIMRAQADIGVIDNQLQNCFQQHAGTVNDLIVVNNLLQQQEAAAGILEYASQKLDSELNVRESWLEKLQKWEEALAAYVAKARETVDPEELREANLGQARCLAALGKWEQLKALSLNWGTQREDAIAPMAAKAAWNLREWDVMGRFVEAMPQHVSNEAKGESSPDVVTSRQDGVFYKAILCVHERDFEGAKSHVDNARKLLALDLAALVLESYERAYGDMVRVQQLAELEEVIEYGMLRPGGQFLDAHAMERGNIIQRMWYDRILGVQHNIEVWQGLLAVRSLVLAPRDDVQTWIKFASLCRKNGRTEQSKDTLVNLLKFDPLEPRDGDAPEANPVVMLAFLKHLWSQDLLLQQEAFSRLKELALVVTKSASGQPSTGVVGAIGSLHNVPGSSNLLLQTSSGAIPLAAKIYLKLGVWQRSLHKGPLEEGIIHEISSSLHSATKEAPSWSKAWHEWSLFNVAASSHHTARGAQPSIILNHVVAAIEGFFLAIALSPYSGEENLQDILRLLTLWFNHGASTDVQKALKEGFGRVKIETWLLVIPQIIARIHSNVQAVRILTQDLLVKIGKHHPQALMYSLLVASKSASSLRRNAAEAVLTHLRQHSANLVQQAQLVSDEFIRIAILWHEEWHEALEEASRLYFGEHNTEGMLKTLHPLHVTLQQHVARASSTGNREQTESEARFLEAYGGQLQEAYRHCEDYRQNGRESELTAAWDLYYTVFRKINKELPHLTTLEMQCVAPALLAARDLELAVPGTYKAGEPVVTIQAFQPQLIVITSKQRPRRLHIQGSDGVDYGFLLKGHEDLRQDERVMQLFGLVNTLLGRARKTKEKDLAIQRYAVIPLSPNSGLIGWVPNHDTFHHLIREYRETRRPPVQVNVEHKHMCNFSQDLDHLPLMAKVEAFEYALMKTKGDDLAKVLWLKSRSSEVWLVRRTNYTRSLAVMSMAGYVLGLGDRHPSNLMLDRQSGKITHIDFGDCFEASMNREKFPERVPFRLTRMLVKAMEVSGIEGTFRSTCEDTMEVLRIHKDSVMAMMEAFVHDPLLNWRLIGVNLPNGHSRPEDAANHPALPPSPTAAPPDRTKRERQNLEEVGRMHVQDAMDLLREKAELVIGRMRDKLTGHDFNLSAPPLPGPPPAGQAGASSSSAPPLDSVAAQLRAGPGLSVKVQVGKLIAQATSHDNLCQSYIGWCPFW